MGYTTDFHGSVTVEPPLSQDEMAFLTKFSGTRRMDCDQGPYYVDRGGFAGQDRDPGVRNYNAPPKGQPGLWCFWVPTEDGMGIEWDGSEKFYSAEEWMEYLIEHFVGSTPKAAAELPFIRPHVLNGEILAQGEDITDRWLLVVKDNVVTTQRLR
jgi:hypothetical protein